MKLKITEKQNLNSIREGTTKEFKSLASAKRWATKNQSFEGTVLVIEDGETLLSYNEGNGWVDEQN